MVEREPSRGDRAGEPPEREPREQPPVPPMRELASAMGNQAFARMVGGQRGDRPPRQVQRMLVQVGSQWAETENANRLRQANPLEYRAGAVSALRRGEVLHIVGHAGGDTFGEFDAAGMFDWLRVGGMTTAVGGIQLHGCESSSFATALAKLLNTPGKGWKPTRQIVVVGVPGYHFVSTEGSSWSVGGTRGDDKLWSQIRADVMKNPSDENLNRLAVEARARGKNLIEVANLKTSASLLRELRQTVRSRLEEEVRAVTRRPGEVITLERETLRSLDARIKALARLTRATLGSAAASSRGEAMAQRAIARALEVLDAFSQHRRSKHLQPHLGGFDTADLIKAREKLNAVKAGLPASIQHATAYGGPIEAGGYSLQEMRALLGQERSASSQARQWAQAWDDRYGSAIELLRDAELQHLKDPLLDLVGKMRFDQQAPEDAPPPALPTTAPEAPKAPAKVEEPDWDAMLADLDAQIDATPPKQGPAPAAAPQQAETPREPFVISEPLVRAGPTTEVDAPAESPELPAEVAELGEAPPPPIPEFDMPEFDLPQFDFGPVDVPPAAAGGGLSLEEERLAREHAELEALLNWDQ